jgi:hypothetical protein
MPKISKKSIQKGLAVLVAGVGPGLAKKQFPGFDFIPIRTHLAIIK